LLPPSDVVLAPLSGRQSSAANVGADKDSDKRQRRAIGAFAKRAGFEIGDADWFYDAGVSGGDPIEGREGFARLLDRIEGNGIRTVIVEDASRFARELVMQELGIALLAKRGVILMTASGDDLTDSDDLGRKMMRQVAGAFMEYEKGAWPRSCVAPGNASAWRQARSRRPENHTPSYGQRWSRKLVAFGG
jgi:resolvase-like protein